MKPIQVFLRTCAYSKVSEIPNRVRPHWFDKKKAKLNLYRTANLDLCEIHEVYDYHFGKENVFAEYNINAGTEAKSFVETFNIVLNRFSVRDVSDPIIYFLEDDYLHREGWCEALIEGIEKSDYVSLYDHADKYRDYNGLRSEILVTKSCHWRDVPSTTNTYAAKFSTLFSDNYNHVGYSVGTDITHDCAKFEFLVKKLGRKLITPIPGFSTHINDYLSPVIDWEKINDQND